MSDIMKKVRAGACDREEPMPFCTLADTQLTLMEMCTPRPLCCERRESACPQSEAAGDGYVGGGCISLGMVAL